MTFAFGHLISAWLFGKINEFLSKKRISHYTWFFLLFGGILPDADFVVDWLLGTEIHRTFTHSLSFFLIPLFFYLIFTIFKNQKGKLYTFALISGIFVHLLVDMLITKGVPLFWPNLLHFSFQGISYFDPATPSFLNSSLSNMKAILKLAVFDMGLGVLWIFYLWWRRKVRF